MSNMKMFEPWEYKNLPTEVQEYINSINGTVIDCYSFKFPMCIEYTVTWVKEWSVITTQKFIYDGEKFRIAKDEELTDCCSVLRWALQLIKDSKELADCWDYMKMLDKKDKKEGAA